MSQDWYGTLQGVWTNRELYAIAKELVIANEQLRMINAQLALLRKKKKKRKPDCAVIHDEVKSND